MVSYCVYYSHIHRDFYQWYQNWWAGNCEDCPFSSHHDSNTDNGHCNAEKELSILSCKIRVQQYIAIDYHKYQKGEKCLLKMNIKKKEVKK